MHDNFHDLFFDDESAEHNLQKRLTPQPISLSTLPVDLPELKPLQIMDIKVLDGEDEDSFSDSEDLSTNGNNRTNSSPPGNAKFLVMFTSNLRPNASKTKRWLRDLEQLGSRKLPLLTKFRTNIAALAAKSTMKEFAESRLRALDSYLSAVGLDLPKKSGATTAGDKFAYQNMNTDSNESSAKRIIAPLKCSSVERPHLETKRAELLDRKKIGLFKDSPNDNKREPVRRTSRAPTRTRTPTIQGTRNSRLPPVQFPVQASKRTPCRSKRSSAARAQVSKEISIKRQTTGRSSPKTVIKEESVDSADQRRQIEEKVDFMLNIQLNEQILKIKKKYYNKDFIEADNITEDLEMIRNVIKLVLNEIEPKKPLDN